MVLIMDGLIYIIGYIKNISHDEKIGLLSSIEEYNNLLIPITVPLVMIRHYIDKHSQEYLKGQIYVSPHAAELNLKIIFD